MTKYTNIIACGTLDIDGYTFEKVKSFMYLGWEVNDENKQIEVKFFRSAIPPRCIKMQLNKTWIIPVLTGAGTQILTPAMENRLYVYERCMTLTQMVGGSGLPV